MTDMTVFYVFPAIKQYLTFGKPITVQTIKLLEMEIKVQCYGCVCLRHVYKASDDINTLCGMALSAHQPFSLQFQQYHKLLHSTLGSVKPD